MNTKKALQELDTALSVSFTNLKYDIREIYRLINEIKNVLIETSPESLKEGIERVEHITEEQAQALNQHARIINVIAEEITAMRAEMNDSSKERNKELIVVFKDLEKVMLDSKRENVQLMNAVNKLLKQAAQRKKEIADLKSSSKRFQTDIKKEMKKELRSVKTAAKTAAKTMKVSTGTKTARKATRKTTASKRSNKTVKKSTAKKASVRKAKRSSKASSSKIMISKVQFQASKKGDLNSEWVEVSGKGDMTGWTIQDKERKHGYAFPQGYKLNGKVRIHTGKGKDTKKDLYWNSPQPIWNDISDVAVLKNDKARIVSRVRSEQTHTFKLIKKNSKVNITAVQFESPGSDRAANGEWIEITGSGRLGGWTIEDHKKKHVFIFPTGFVLRNKVRIYSGNGPNTDTKLFWGSSQPIWNDDYDKCTLKDNDGKIVSQAESKRTHTFEVLI